MRLWLILSRGQRFSICSELGLELGLCMLVVVAIHRVSWAFEGKMKEIVCSLSPSERERQRGGHA